MIGRERRAGFLLDRDGGFTPVLQDREDAEKIGRCGNTSLLLDYEKKIVIAVKLAIIF